MNKKKILILFTIFIILIAILFKFVILKIIVYKKIESKFALLKNSDNYYIRETNLLDDTLCMSEVWQKNKNYLQKNTTINASDNTVNIYTYDSNEYNSYFILNGELQSEDNENIKNKNSIKGKDFKELSDIYDLKDIFSYSLSTETINGKKCYKISYLSNNETVYIEKETGLPLRKISKTNKNDTILNYSYSFDNVKDEDLGFSI